MWQMQHGPKSTQHVSLFAMLTAMIALKHKREGGGEGPPANYTSHQARQLLQETVDYCNSDRSGKVNEHVRALYVHSSHPVHNPLLIRLLA